MSESDFFLYLITIGAGTIVFPITILGIVVPVTYNIIAGISERYKSVVISNLFFEEKFNYYIRFFLFLCLFLIISLFVLMFLFYYFLLSWLKFIISAILLVILVGSFILIYQFFKLFKNYSLNIDYIFDKLFNEAKEITNINIEDKENKEKNEKTIEQIKNRYIKALEGIGDVLVVEVKEKRNFEKVKGILDKIREEIVKDLLSKPKLLKKIAFTENYIEDNKKNIFVTEFILRNKPKTYLSPLLAPFNQIERTIKTALESGNYEISKFSLYNLYYLLSDFSESEDYELFVKIILDLNNKIIIEVIQKQNTLIDKSFEWYPNIVFCKFGNSFNLSFLGVFSAKLIELIRFVISVGQENLFEGMVDSLFGREHVSDRSIEIWEYSRLYQRERKKVTDLSKQLCDLIPTIYTQDALNGWLKLFDELKKIIENNIDEKTKEEAKKIERDIKEFVESKYKYNTLLVIAFWTGAYCISGAYCIYRTRYDFVKTIIHECLKQLSPITYDSISQTINEILMTYNNMDIFGFATLFSFDEPQAEEGFYDRYFLLLLAQVLQKRKKYDIKNNMEEDIEKIILRNYKLPPLQIQDLDKIKGKMEILTKCLGDAQYIDNFKNLCKQVEINDVDVEILKKLVDKIYQDADEQIDTLNKEGKISKSKVEEFANDVMKSFNNNAMIRNIFKHLKLYETSEREKEREKESETEKEHTYIPYINRIDDKAAFFDDWYASYPNWGEHYGIEIATQENNTIILEIIKQCKHSKTSDFLSIIPNKDFDNYILLATPRALWELTEQTKGFVLKPSIKEEQKDKDCKELKGWFILDDKKLEVFGIPELFWNRDMILLINKSTIGEFIQISPKTEENGEFIKDIFVMNIRSLSEHTDIIDELIKSSPEWLIKEGDTPEQQREFLMKKVQVIIKEKVYFKVPENFEGYIINL